MKSDLSSVLYSTRVTGQRNFYKVPETHGHTRGYKGPPPYLFFKNITVLTHLTFFFNPPPLLDIHSPVNKLNPSKFRPPTQYFDILLFTAQNMLFKHMHKSRPSKSHILAALFRPRKF